MDKESKFYDEVVSGKVKLIYIPDGTISLNRDEVIALQKCGVALKSDEEIIADLED